jgi:hypothetical protein
VEHVWSVLAQQAITSQETKNVSLIDLIEEVKFAPMPGQKRPKGIIGLPVKMALVTRWTRSKAEKPEEGRARVQIRDPRGKLIQKESIVEYDVNLTEFINFRATATFDSFPYTINGIYKVVVQSHTGDKWRLVASVPIQVNETEQIP